MKQLIIAIILVVSLAAIGFTLEDDLAAPELMMASQMFADLEGTTLPGPAQKFIKTGDVNVYLTTNDNTEVSFAILIRDGVIDTLQNDVSVDPTLDLRATQSFLESLDDSNNPLKNIKEGIKDDSFSYKAYGLFNKMKFKFLFTFMNVGSFVVHDDGESSEQEHTKKMDNDEALNDKVKITDTAPETDESEDDSSSVGGLLTGSIVSDEVADVVEDLTQTHYVEFVDDGFSPLEVTINVGDTVVWQNVREGHINKAFVVGTRTLIKARSKILMPGDSYSWTFDTPGMFVFVDGIMTTKVMNVLVEE